MRLDWRPHVGLTEAHRGTVVERILARSVLDESIELHNKDVRAQNKAST